MAIVINGSGTVTGISVGGLPDGIVDSGTLATNSVDSAELIDGSIDNSHLADDAVDSDEIAAGAIDAAHFASGVGGKVLQVVEGSATGTTTVSTTSDTYLTTLVTITPSATTSKVWVFLDLGHETEDAADYGFTAKLSIDDGVSYVWTAGTSGYAHRNQGGSMVTHREAANFNIIFSPSTTSALSYKVYVQDRNTNTVTYNSGCKTRIYAMEIGA